MKKGHKKRNKKSRKTLRVRLMSSKKHYRVEKTPYVIKGVKYFKIKSTGKMILVNQCMIFG